MNNNASKNFYLFKGEWHNRFAEIINMIGVKQQQLIAVWTPKNKAKKHNLLIVSGTELPQSYCLDKSIWKTNETVFESFYEQRIKNYDVYSNGNLEGNAIIIS